MPSPVLLAAVYLAVNLAITVWIAREEAGGRTPTPQLVIGGRIVRYGPALLGLAYLVTIAGDWPFFLFVVFFFAAAFWLLDGLLSYPSRPPKR